MSKLDLKIIIFNNVDGEHKEFIETVILSGKQYIYACKCTDEIPKLTGFLSRIHTLYTNETIANTNPSKKINAKWKKYREQIT